MAQKDTEQQKRIKIILGNLKISQPEFAKNLGLDAKKFNNIATGYQKIPNDLGLLIQEKYGYSFTWLLTGQGEMYNCGDDMRVQHKLDCDIRQEIKDQFKLTDDEINLLVEELLTSESTRDIIFKFLRCKKSNSENIDQLIGFLQGLKTKYER